jgi:processive 1,2-diacylglycerol beta-glucosyltransferase
MVAAAGIEQALRARLPGHDVRVLDILQRSLPFFRKLYADGYLAMVNRLPSLMGWMYRVTDHPPSGVGDRMRVAFQNACNRRLVRDLLRDPPGLIINTHFLPAELVAQLRRAGRLNCPQFIVTTDYETHHMWVQEPAERYYTANRRGATHLCECGVDPLRVVASGIPVRAGFESHPAREQIRRREGLRLELPVLLLLCGGGGFGPAREAFERLLSIDAPAQIVAVTGRNAALRAELERAAQRSHKTARVLGYTDCIHEWMAAADLLISKPGGLTVSEALVSGLPMVIVHPIPGPETRNSDYLLEKGAAIKVNALPLLPHAIEALLGDPQRLSEMRRCALNTARPGAAARIAEDAARVLGVEPARIVALAAGAAG